MNKRTYVIGILAFSVILHLIGFSDIAQGETGELRIAKQYGLPYLPLIIMEEHKLIEKHARKAGLGDVKVIWSTLGGGASTNEALISGAVDYAASGVAPMVQLWGKTNGAFRGVAALGNSPMFLNTVNPAVKSIADFSAKDRIALPAAKVSIQAIVLQMEAARRFGIKNYERLDQLTVSMKHPDAMSALLSGHSEITAHFATPPFSFRELEDKRVHKVLSSYDVLGGPHTQNVLISSDAFRQKNPRLFVAVLNALEEAVAFIKKNKRASAEIYIRTTKSKERLSDVLAEIDHPLVTYSTVPLRTSRFSDFMYHTGSVKKKAGRWQDLFFDNIHNKKGS